MSTETPRVEWWAICDNCGTVTVLSPSIDRTEPIPDPNEWERFPECMVCDNSAGSLNANLWSSDVAHDTGDLLAQITRLKARLAEAWDEGFVAGSEWQPGHADGIPRDPAPNPYREQSEENR